MDHSAARSFRTIINRYLPLAFSALIIFAVSISLFYVSKEYAYRKQTVRDNIKSAGGIWDLRDIDFDARIEFIDGEVEYIPGALLSPDEFESRSSEAVIGYVPSDMRVATARMRIIVAPGLYMISGSSIDYNDRIYINNEWQLDVGSPGMTKEESVAGTRYIKLEADALDGVIEIVRQSSNFVHKENSAYAGFWIGNPVNMTQMIALQEMPANIIVGLYLALFLVHLIVWLLFRGYRSNLWFSLLCFVGLVNAGFIGRRVFWSMFPELPWSAAYKMSYVAVVLTGMFIMLLMNDEFSGLVQKWALRVFSVIYAAVALYSVCVDTILISRTGIVAEIIVALSAAYLVARFIWLLRKKEWRQNLRIEHAFTVFGVSVAVAAFLHDVFYRSGIHIVSYEIADVGVLSFILFQTAAMFYATMRKYSDAQLEAEAAHRKADELQTKTDFYRRMSHDLRTPLTKISTNIQMANRLEDTDHERLAESQDEIMRMASLINDALDDKAEDGESGGYGESEVNTGRGPGAE